MNYQPFKTGMSFKQQSECSANNLSNSFKDNVSLGRSQQRLISDSKLSIRGRDSSLQEQQQQYKLNSVNMTYVFESLFQEQENIEEQMETENGIPNNICQGGAIKMMDTILFKNGFQPKKWIFTDLLGRIQFKSINSITINDVIRAFLVNLNEHKKNEFNNEDLMEFLSSNTNKSKICFAIVGNTRHFLDIGALSDIKNKFIKGIDGLQLYKIPTRDFLPYFYYHSLQFKTNGILLSHSITRVSHFVQDLGNKTQRNSELYEEKVPDEDYDYFAFQMLEISKHIIHRVQIKDPFSIVKDIKIAYLIESNNYDPWFIGTEHCFLYKKEIEKTNRSTSKSLNKFTRSSSNKFQNENKRSFVNKFQNDLNVSSRIDTSQGSQSKRNYDKQQDVYEFSQNQYVTQSDLFKGLQQIGQQYGKDNGNLQIKRPRTMQVLTEEKSKNMMVYQQKIQDQRNKLKEKGRRIISLFPKYIDKSGSKAHAQFLFGNASSNRVFKDYQRLRFQKQQTDETILMKNHTQYNNTSASFQQKQLKNQSIFDIPMSQVNNEEQSQITEMPYQDHSYYEQSYPTENNNQDLYDVNQELILNKNISMFHNQDQSGVQQHDNLSGRGSIISYKVSQANCQNDYLNKSIIESQMLDQSKIQLGNNEFEKNMISLMMINQELQNVVVIDKDEAKNKVQQKLKMEELRRKLESQQSTQSEQIFDGKRRKLNQVEARTYQQWQKVLHDQVNTQQDDGATEVKLQIKTPKTKRSKTAIGFRKQSSQQRKKQSTLSLLQIQGQEAKLEAYSKLESIKKYQENKEQTNQRRIDYHKSQLSNINQQRSKVASQRLQKSYQNTQQNSKGPSKWTPREMNTKTSKADQIEQDKSAKAVFLRIIDDVSTA